jgi:uncharacterized protein
MFQRDIIAELEKWRLASNRKPLILRGARQVGKTTAVQQFAAHFKQYLYLNLERKEDAAPFKSFSSFDTLVEALFFLKNKNVQERDTLLFIDEIQAAPEAINLLRYFYEDYPWIRVVAAGSLLETILKEEVAVPVGRVEYRVMRPVSFREFLAAIGEHTALAQLTALPVQAFAHDRLLRLFHRYTLIGGMPEIVQQYAENQNLATLLPVYESLQESFLNDVEKYARGSSLTQVIRHTIRSMPFEAGNRIKFQHFGQSNYGSREIGEALRTLEKAMLLRLVYPCTGVIPPALPDLRKSPKLHLLDTGLMNFAAGIQKDVLTTDNLQNIYQGKVAEQMVAQEILAAKFNTGNELRFWVREKSSSTAEIDFIVVFEGQMIPIEVKSGETGRLRSLHLFMDNAPHQLAIRLYAGPFKIDQISTPSGKPYRLLNLPYYLAGQIEQYLEWMH